MIQRIQSIFLALATLSAGGLFGLPFATTEEAAANSGIFADSVYNINDHLVLLVSFTLAGLAALVAIFLFKNRKLQMTLSTVAIIASVIGIGFGLFKFLSDPAQEQAGFGLGAVLPLLLIIFAFLGWRNIKQDEQLVRSMDRLR